MHNYPLFLDLCFGGLGSYEPGAVCQALESVNVLFVEVQKLGIWERSGNVLEAKG